jgi:hypothetical protein
VSRGLAAAVLLAALATTASAQALGAGRAGAFTARNVTLKDQGSFFIGGVNKSTRFSGSSTAGNYASIVIGQMYVQFQIPTGWNPNIARRQGKFPVIMVHGSTHTGAALESTADYKESWGPQFVAAGVPVFIVDQSGRGRSGFDNSVIHEGQRRYLDGHHTTTPFIPNFGRITSNGAWTAWFGHLVLPGTATTCTDILTCELMPHGWRHDDPSLPTVHPNPAGYGPLFPISGVGLDQGQTQGGSPGSNTPPGVTADFGPTPYGPADAYKLHYYKQLVPNAEVTLPGSTCATCVPQTLGPTSTWTPYALALLVERIAAKAGGAVIATHSQSGIMGHHAVRLLRQRGNLQNLKGLITIEGGCSFANSGLTAADFDNVAYMPLKGDYTGTSADCLNNVNAINARRAAMQGTARAEYIQLDEARWGGRFNGETHMMMVGTNARAVGEVMLEWAGQYIR